MKRLAVSALSFALFLVCGEANGEELPVLPLAPKVPPSEYRGGDFPWWEDFYGDNKFEGTRIRDPLWPEFSLTRMDGGLKVFSSADFLDKDAEIVFVDPDGNFEGSWCSGRFVFASIVTPQFDEEGRSLPDWEVPYFDLNGELISEEESQSISDSLKDTAVFPEGMAAPSIPNFRENVVFSYVVSQIEMEEVKLPWTSQSVECFNVQNFMGSHSAHGSSNKNSAVGEAEMFLWHSAPVRYSWDLSADGDLISESIQPRKGERFLQGGTVFEVITVEPGIFNGRSVDSESDLYCVEFSRPVAEGWTCILGSNLRGRNIVSVEYRDESGDWIEAPSASEEFGIISVDLPDAKSEEDLPEIRVLWSPGTLRVVADISSIGGGLRENEGVTTYNEIGFPFCRLPMDTNSNWWRLYHFLGYQFVYPNDTGEFSEKTILTEPGKLYYLRDLISGWNEMNPNYQVSIDSEKRTVTFLNLK